VEGVSAFLASVAGAAGEGAGVVWAAGAAPADGPVPPEREQDRTAEQQARSMRMSNVLPRAVYTVLLLLEPES